MLSIQLFNQVLVIFILMMTGAVLYKLKIFTEAGASQATKVLLTVVMPAVIINSVGMTLFWGLLLQLLFSLITLV